MAFQPSDFNLPVNRFTINDEECEQLDFCNRVVDGFYRSYYSNGQLFAETKYKGAHVVGGFKYYYSNGQKKCFASAKNAVRHGVNREWDREGNITCEDVYLDGRLIGTLKQILDSRGPFWILLNFDKEEM
jgi:antitoxin component YwqK of YwqJK toxin-antitoxin module